jgi:hypothetical protein
MKKMLWYVLWVGIATGCNEQPKQVSPDEFTRLAVAPIATMVYSEFAGVKDGKAILRVSRMSSYRKSKWKDTVYVTDAAKLDAEVLKKLRSRPKPYR